MATRVLMAKLSPTMEEGRVLKWLKDEGDTVEMGDAVVEIETDKATMEVEALGAGVLRKKLVEEGTTVPTGTLLGVVAGEDEEIDELLESATAGGHGAAAAAPDGEAEETGAAEGAEAAEPRLEARRAEAKEPRRRAAGDGEAAEREPGRDGGRIKASPVARRMADREGIELARVRGSGPGGRIIKRDIEAALREGVAAPSEAPTAGEPVGPEVPFETVELSQMRKAIARNMAQSLGPIPHFYLTTEIDMERVLALRAELNQSLADRDVKIGINEILMKVAARALEEHPNVNVSFAGDHLRRFRRVDIGLAVALPDGLITPVVRNVGAKGLRRISEEAKDLIARARDKKLQPDEYQGATFTISNLGMFGIDEFTAVINPPAATILAVGAVTEKPVVMDGAVEIRARMRVTLSCDHRAVDGATGAEFLATFREMLENPLRIIS
jgi:pyruvate dehydrogenase E2 component (dihydrolipoamide acetyltransferase)